MEAIILPLLAFLLQAAIPASAEPAVVPLRYEGPGMMCGAAFAIHLRDGESMTLTGQGGPTMIFVFDTQDGRFTVRESQYATQGVKRVRAIGDGHIGRKRDAAAYVWIYRNNAPGSTDLYGPAIGSSLKTVPLNRIIFQASRYGSVGQEKCLPGRSG